MTRSSAERLDDILRAVDAINAHMLRGPSLDPLSDGLVFDAVRVRLIEIGEAVNSLGKDITATEPDIPWGDITGMRNRLAHRYFDTLHAIVASTVSEELPKLRAAAERMRSLP